MKVVYFHRKPWPNRNFSIENLFANIRRELPDELSWEIREARYHSQGFFRRLYIGLESAIHQGEVNHITGGINFIAMFLSKRRTLLTIHDIGFMKHRNVLLRKILYWFWLFIPVKRSAMVTTVSKATLEEIQKFVRFDPSRARVIYNPVSPLFVPSTKAFNKLKPCILQVGTKPNKNIPILLSALHGITCKLEILGEANEQLLNEFKSSSVEYEFFTGLTDEEVAQKYRTADLLAYVSTYEGFGLPIVEANASGLPVVTSNTSSMPEIAGGAAYLVNPFDADSIRAGILKVIHDDRLRESLIENGFRNCLRFDAKKIAIQYVDLYHEINACGTD